MKIYYQPIHSTKMQEKRTSNGKVKWVDGRERGREGNVGQRKGGEEVSVRFFFLLFRRSTRVGLVTCSAAAAADQTSAVIDFTRFSL